MNEQAHTVRHFLAALAYRFQKVVKDAPFDFGAFSPGYGIRPPITIVHHMNGILGYARVILERNDPNYWHEVPEGDWAEGVALLHRTLAELDAILAMQAVEGERLERLLQGPLADSMTHVGQLAMLRRMAGAPLHGENFFKADIRAGQVSEVQPEPVSPDP